MIEEFPGLNRMQLSQNSSDDLCQMLFLNSLDAIFLTEPDGNIRNANPAACKMFGRTVEEFCHIGRSGIIDISDPRLAVALEERQRTGKFTGELTGIRSDGSRFPLEISSSYFIDKDAKILISNIIRDVTARKKAEEDLRRSELKYRKLHESIQDGFVFVEMSGHIKESNAAYRSMLGYTTDELEALTYRDLTPAKWILPEDQIVREQVLVRGYSETYEKEYIRKDGTIFPIELRTILVKNDEGENVGMWAFVRDITERKKTEKLLISSEKNLRELNAAKDKFFSIIAHDLRNPFTAIHGYSHILEQKVRERNFTETIKYAEIIQESTQKNLHLLTQLMDWALSQDKGMKFNAKPLNIAALVKETAGLLNDSLQQKKIVLDIELPSRMSWQADQYMIGSVLRNLISNAIKFTRPGGRIVITARKSQNELLVSVRDTGIGIRKELMEKLFSIDESVPTPGTLDEPGTGLGLLLCKEFIYKHGGKIWVESEEGAGSTFYFSIPRLS